MVITQFWLIHHLVSHQDLSTIEGGVMRGLLCSGNPGIYLHHESKYLTIMKTGNSAILFSSN